MRLSRSSGLKHLFYHNSFVTSQPHVPLIQWRCQNTRCYLKYIFNGKIFHFCFNNIHCFVVGFFYTNSETRANSIVSTVYTPLINHMLTSISNIYWCIRTRIKIYICESRCVQLNSCCSNSILVYISYDRYALTD